MLHLTNYPKAREIEFREGRQGFWMTFENGWGISVQWSRYNYCDGGMSERGGSGMNAEIAVLKPGNQSTGRLGGDILDGISEWGDSVIGYLWDFEVLKAMFIVSAFSPEVEPEVASVTFHDLFWSAAKV